MYWSTALRRENKENALRLKLVRCLIGNYELQDKEKHKTLTEEYAVICHDLPHHHTTKVSFDIYLCHVESLDRKKGSTFGKVLEKYGEFSGKTLEPYRFDREVLGRF